MKPLDMRGVGDREFLITWEDSHRSLYTFEDLRANCPCASCVDEITGSCRIVRNRIAADIRPLETEPVGNYGIRFRWSDGHHTGIYSFGWLRELCPCKICAETARDARAPQGHG